jgi:hypothetical protein
MEYYRDNYNNINISKTVELRFYNVAETTRSVYRSECWILRTDDNQGLKQHK